MVLILKAGIVANSSSLDAGSRGTTLPMPDDGLIPARAMPAKRSSPYRLSWWCGLGVAVAAVVWFGVDLAGEPHFMDESAMDSQSYFADLLVEGRRDDPAWLEYPGYDSSPLPKYLIGLTRRTCGHPRPGRADAFRWFANTSYRCDPPGALVVARWPFAIGGAIGCVAVYALGILARDRKTGLLAAFLLMINPLYQMHARRAMADVLVEAFLLTCLALLLWSWRRILAGRGGPAAWLAAALAGVAAGLAALAKLNGGLALLIVLAWLVLALALPGFPIRRRLAFVPAVLVATVVAAMTFVAFNPFLTAHPKGPLTAPVAAIAKLGFWSRLRMLVVHRAEMARNQMRLFPHNALNTPVEKLKVAAIQGFGRFGPFGPRHPDPKASERRYEWAQDRGALVWLPWVGAGLVWALAHGYRQWASRVPPTGWAIAVQAVVAGIVVIAYLPLAWDRYLLPLQPGSALLAAGAAAAAADRLAGAGGRLLRRPELWVFITLLGSYAFFWHSRDWNSASRLMLTYSIVDRGTIIIDGLDEQTGDKAFFEGHYYSDKLPGFSLLATGPYALAKLLLKLPDHPLNRRGFAYWPADYWVTLGTSALFTALTGVLLSSLARALGCTLRQAELVALAYGLTTPAYAYATMSYGHQVSSFALLTSFALLWRTQRRQPFPSGMFAAGFLAAAAAVVELSLGPIAAILGLYLLVQVIGRKRPAAALVLFISGAIIPTLVLLGYNELAFGSPWEMGYFHHATKIFADVHNPNNPLGLRRPDWSKAGPLLWGGYRGLLFYAPVVAASVPGWFVLLARRRWDVAVVSALAVTAVFLVNLSYPEWTGGWSTGPRLLVPLLPFAMLPVAGLLAAGGRGATLAVLVPALWGGALNLLFQGVGGRLSQDITDPIRMAVWPLWSGAPVPPWWVGSRFTRNLCREAFPGFIGSLPARWQWIQFLPLVVFQALAIAVTCRLSRDRSKTRRMHDRREYRPRPHAAARDSPRHSTSGVRVVRRDALPLAKCIGARCG